MSTSNGDYEIWRAGGMLSSRYVARRANWSTSIFRGWCHAISASWTRLARLRVLVSRGGALLRLHGVDGGLAKLLAFVGRGDVMDLCGCCRGPAQSPPI